MSKRVRNVTNSCLTAVLWALLSVSCSLIDDTLGECAHKDNYELDYELRLVTNMTTELQTQLSTQTEISLAHSLRTYLSDIFTDFAHDVDLSFYDTQGDSLRLQHDEHIMDANQASYTLNLPKRQYMHLATANIVDNELVDLVDDERCHRAKIVQLQGATPSVAGASTRPAADGSPVDNAIESHSTGIFTARQPMEVLEGIDQQFDVRLYMANCSAVLVIDTIGSGIKGLWVYSTGFATGFNVADSSYIFVSDPPIVRTRQVINEDDESGELAFCSVNFPSREADNGGEHNTVTRTIIETEDPFITPLAEESLWEFHIYATASDESITLTKLFIRRPLRAGQLMIIKAKARPDGSVDSPSEKVGISVTLNWNEGGHYNPEF